MKVSSAGSSIQAAATKVVGNDDVGYSIKHELNVVGIRGTRLVTVDLFGRTLVLGLELGLDVCGCLLICLLAWNKEKNVENI